jgi:hypothetical protein
VHLELFAGLLGELSKPHPSSRHVIMLDDVGRYWTMLDDVGRCWTTHKPNKHTK